MQARRERLSEALASVTAVEVRQIYSVEVASGASTLNGHGWTCSHVTAGTIVCFEVIKPKVQRDFNQ